MKTYYCILIAFYTSTAFGQVEKCDYKVFYNPDQTKREEGCVENGKRTGEWKEYTEGTNRVRFTWTYVNNRKDGPYKALYEDGTVEAAGRYTDDMLDDSLKMYNRKGELVEIEIWKSNGGSISLVKTIQLSDQRPDGTIDVIDGKIYMWRDGEKVLVDSIDIPVETKKKKKRKEK
jgi:hypothetical protein